MTTPTNALEILQPAVAPGIPSAAEGLLSTREQAYVTETPTGLAFASDTPIEVWSGLVSWLIVTRQRISFALADAINFGRDAYGEDYAQWVDETGLQETTLMNVAWVGRQVPISRRRAGVDFTYHQAVAALPPDQQETLLDAAVEHGWKRYQLRAAVRSAGQASAGQAVALDGTPLPTPELPWSPTAADLVDRCRSGLEARLSAMSPGRRSSFSAGWIAAHVEAGATGCFRRTD